MSRRYINHWTEDAEVAKLQDLRREPDERAQECPSDAT